MAMSASAAVIGSSFDPDPPTMMGGCGLCTGRGLLYALSIEKCRPRDVGSFCVHIALMSWIPSRS